MLVSTDYLVVGAGASALAFVDALVAEADVEVTVIDRRPAPGGHWLDAYPFVRLHTPSAYYGVNSLPLGRVGISRLAGGWRLMSMTSHRLRLYDYAASGNCYKVRLLLAHLGIEYERVAVDIFAGETLGAEYAPINPMRTTPVLQTADGLHLPDSNAILLYLARGSAYLPEDPYELAQTVRWLIYEQTDVVPMIGGLRFRLLTGRLEASDPDAVRRHTGAGEVLALIEGHLAVNDFFVAGRYTIADIAIYGYTHRAREARLDLEPYASVRSWLQRVERQPGYLEDLQPYGANAAPRAGRSIYD